MANPTTNLGMALPQSEYDAQKVATYNAALQTLDALFAAGAGAAWAPWTPSWTNLTLGDGTAVAKYARVGKIVIARLSIVFGGTTSVSGMIAFSLPVNRAAFAGIDDITPIGHARLFDTSAPLTVEGVIISSAVGTAGIAYHGVSGALLVAIGTGATVPFTWATGDEVSLQIVYEAA